MPLSIDLARAETASFEPSESHAALAAMVGRWAGPTKLWLDESSTPSEEARADLLAELILGGRWLRLSYRSSAFGGPHAGEMLIGFHKEADEHELAWIDSVHTGSSIMWSNGKRRPDGVIDVLGSYAAGDQRWGWRTRLRKPAPDQLLLEAFNIEPQREEQRALEWLFTRVG